jgi:hypothetical protein
MDVNEWISYECSDKGSSIGHTLRTFIIHLLVDDIALQREHCTIKRAQKFLLCHVFAMKLCFVSRDKATRNDPH